ncbi:carbohydrate ABC transporter permease [Reyranella sp.]|uniref:carbohydrate ABC transporter permease n=1 Tax=Reyranella sp. TaxID=1929291 RepID=UPI003D099913
MTSTVRRKKPLNRKWLFLLPALIVSLGVVLVPVIVTTLLAFSDWNGFSIPKWVGLSNFTTVMQEAKFWAAFRNNCIYTLLFATLPMICSLFAAMMLMMIRRGRTFFQVVYFLPVTIATVILALIWRSMIYSPTTGVIGWLQQLGIPIDNPLVNVDTSLLGVLFVDMWSWWGYLTVIYFAALRQVDRSLIEAALVDGASRWQTFWHVLRPTILPTVLFMLLMSVIWSFRVFDWIFVLTEGGPGFSSEVLATLAYKTAFQSFEVGRASAYSLSMSLLGLAAIVIYLRIQARREKA